jgi:hypothetical protein
VVDDALGIVTALKTTTGIVNEAHQLMGLVDQHQVNAGVAAKTIIADCKYGTVENYIACQNRKLRTYMIYWPAALGVGSGMRSIRNRSSSTAPRVTPICARLVK